MVTTSKAPVLLATSSWTLARRLFSSRTVKFTLMPVSLVKLSAVSFWMSVICELPTISTLIDFLPPPESPAPEQAASRDPTTAAVASTAVARSRVEGMVELPPSWGAWNGTPGGVRGLETVGALDAGHVDASVVQVPGEIDRQ